MHAKVAVLAALASACVAAPYNPFPLPDGFPAPNDSQLAEISSKAGGTLPNGGSPSSLTDDSVTTLQLIALNEQFEVAFFTQLLQNITSGAYDLSGFNQTVIESALTAIVNQEELHAIGANGILQGAGATTIQPCQYQFPVTTFVQAITLANTFTDVVLSTLPVAQVGFATAGGNETGLVQLLGSIIGQEGEQNGWFRSLQGKTPSAAPFLTTGNPGFAFTALQNFIVPGSCPNINILSEKITTFGNLDIVSGVSASGADSTVNFAIPAEASVSADAWSVVYYSGQNKPVVQAISNVQTSGEQTTFSAQLPFSQGFANGLTLAALLNCTGIEFDTVDASIEYVRYGPGLIEVN